MGNRVAQSPIPQRSITTAKTALKPRQVGVGGLLKKPLRLIASLRLTVGLFVLSIMLVFFATLAQRDEGIFTVLTKYIRTPIAWIPFQVLVGFGQVFFWLPAEAKVPGHFPFPGGWLIGGVLLLNLLAAHAARFKLSWKRIGILFLHAGLIFLMVGELVTGIFAVEGRMSIPENSSANFTEDYHAVELAVIDQSDPKVDDVVVIPGSLLRRGGLIRHDLLPFDVEVIRYMVNSAEPQEAGPGIENPATVGDGVEVVAVEKPEVSGADSDQGVDLPSAYVRFRKKDTGKSLGTYLLSVWWSVQADRPQHVTAGGTSYDVSLRFKRTYKPYTVHLLEFKHDVYIGTNTPKNYSSRVHLVDPQHNEDREVLIYMNHPLWYEGETFYQSGFLPGDRGTILQVVRNPGWYIPYVSCTMVAVGMLTHFGIGLIVFLSRMVPK